MTEMRKLEIMLNTFNVPFEITRHYSGTKQIWYPNCENPICDVICFGETNLGGSYGHEKGLLEIMGLVNEEETDDSVEGYLTAEEVFERMWDDYITWRDEDEDDEE